MTATGPRLGWGWRLACWVVAVAFGLVGVGALVPSSATVASAAGFLAVAGISYAAWRWVDRRRRGRTPLSLSASGARALVVGLAAGVALVGFVVTVLGLTGAYAAEPRACSAADAVDGLSRGLALFLAAAGLEEILFRGYLLTTLRDGIGARWAVVATAALFALAHLGNPHLGPLAAFNLVWVGGALGLVVLYSGSLWSAIGLHAGWNLALAVGAAVPVSGLSFGSPCWVGLLAGPEWWSGGAFGIESSPVATLAWGLVGWWVVSRRRVAPRAV